MRIDSRPEMVATETRRLPTIERRVLWLLSVGISLDESALRSLYAASWDDGELAATAVQRALHWPFIVGVGSYYVLRQLRSSLARQFRDADSVAFKRAHEHLVAVERKSEAQGDDGWYAKGRIAFYLAATDRPAAIHDFGAAFESSPTLDREAARAWLSALALDQREFLGDNSAIVAFFEGFRLYVSGRRDEALEWFTAVLGAHTGDWYEAVALHLSGVIQRDVNPAQSEQLLRDSIRLSDRLRLSENGVMARHSLVSLLLQRGRPPYGQTDALAQADVLASETLAKALDTSDPSLITWCRRMRVATRWRYLTDFGRLPDRGAAEAEGLLQELVQVRTDALAVAADTETGAIALHDALLMLANLKKWGEGIEWLVWAATELSQRTGDRSLVGRVYRDGLRFRGALPPAVAQQELASALARLAMNAGEPPDQLWDLVDVALPVGTQLQGTVSGVADALGVFVDVDGWSGMAHRSAIGPEGVQRPSKHLTVGAQVDVVVLGYRVVGRDEYPRLDLGMPTAVGALYDQLRDEMPVGSTVRASVTGVQDDLGIFVDADGWQGLVHRSKIGGRTIAQVSRLFRVGEDAEVTVIGYERGRGADKRPRLALSIRQIPTPLGDVNR